MTQSSSVTDSGSAMFLPTPSSLHEQFFTDLVRTAALMTDDRFAAEEIVQEAFTQLVARWDRIDPDRALAYLYRSVANGARSTLRRRRTVRAHRPEPPQYEAAADASVLRAAGYDALLAAVARLPRRQRQVLVLRYFAELSIADTAEALGLSGTAVTAATHRAVHALAQKREEFR
jgi:RNA polymerase sigma-70 factor (sigma-E family)